MGLDNYVRMTLSPETSKIFTNTLTYVVCTLVLFNVGLAMVISLLTTSMNKTAGSLFRALWLLPRITPSVIYIIMWQFCWPTSLRAS